jgi:hypothetical protein
MSKYLWDEMIVSALLETNNMFQFSKFAKQHFDSWVTKQMDPIPNGSTFVDAFQIWLQVNYESNEGNHLPNNEKEGVVQYPCCYNTPTLLSISYNNVRVFHSMMKLSLKQMVIEVEYWQTLTWLDKAMEGVSFKIQKMIYI